MAIDYTKVKSTLDEIADRSVGARNRMERARAQLAQAEAELSAMASEYAVFVQELDALAQGNTNSVWGRAKAEKDQMVADFNAMRTRAQNLLAAYDSVQ